jgi:hypothetical protein
VGLHVVLPPGSMRSTPATGRSGAEDEAWRAWRSQWPGAIRLYAYTGVATLPTSGVRLRFDSVATDDAVRAAFALHVGDGAARSASETSRLVVLHRGGVARVDDEPGTVAVVWPRDGVPNGWRSVADTTDAIVANGVALVASWARPSRAPLNGGAASRPIAWWSDGEPAAVERHVGLACVREVGVRLNVASDLLLDDNAHGLLDVLLAPCVVDAAPTTSALTLRRIDSTGMLGTSATSADVLRRADASILPTRVLAAMCLAAALLALLVESIVRARQGGPDAVAGVRAPRAETRRT